MDVENFDRPSVYRIRVRGRLDGMWRDYVANMEIAVREGGPGQPTATELTGFMPDQAALMGVLAHLHARGIAIIDVARLEAERGEVRSKAERSSSVGSSSRGSDDTGGNIR